ncbi:MAG: GIY-YIG nuclease family protein [Deltaproteobacteria bacterium]|nr:GIY-YIG nuclease family protein [Deltaproteobacteria bacterium]
MDQKKYYVYIITNRHHTVFYTGRTDDIKRRRDQHEGKWKQAFTKKYNISKLVYFEEIPTQDEAILTERRIKKLSRNNKIKLIEKLNPQWHSLL